MIEVNEVTLK